jgi:transcriptional regulator with XRE-family HTH domain/tetratricopeptide (TPR) repeat protein
MPSPLDGYLAELRRAAGLTQEELAERCGLSVRAISAIESGRVERPHRKSLLAIADALDLDDHGRAGFIRAYRSQYADLPPRPPAMTPRQLPPRPPGLHGRDTELATLEALLAGGAPAGPVVVNGLGGIGKTALAIEACARRTTDYPDGCLFADLSRADGRARDPAAVLGEFLFAVGVEARALPDGLAARSALWRSITAQRRLLVMLDDPVDEAQVRPLLTPEPSAVVIATRAPLGGLDAALRVRLRPLDDSAAAAILAGVPAGRAAPTGADLDAMVQACAGMPLALRLLAARLGALPDVAPGELAGRLEQEDGRLDELSFGDRSVRRSIEGGLRQLSPAARQLLGTLAAIDVADFGAWLFTALSDGAPDQAVDELLAFGLLEPAASVDGRMRHRLHDLVRATARGDAGPLDTPTLRRVLAWAGHLAEGIPPASLASPVPHVLAPDRPSALTDALRARLLGDRQQWFAGEWRTLLRLVDLARLAGEHAGAGGLLAAVQRPLHRAGLLAPLLAVARRCAESESPPLVRGCARVVVASVSAELGRYDDALVALNGLQSALSEADVGTRATAAYELAWLSERTGDLVTAESAYTTAIALHASIGNDYGEAGSQIGLATALATLPQRAPDALAHARRALTLAERIGDSRSVSKIVIMLARRPAFDALANDLDGRLSALQVAAEATGDLTVAVGCLTTLAMRSLRAGQPAAALAAAERAVEIIGHADRPSDLADALHERARSHAALGESAAARADYAATLALREQLGQPAQVQQLRAELAQQVPSGDCDSGPPGQ